MEVAAIVWLASAFGIAFASIFAPTESVEADAAFAVEVLPTAAGNPATSAVANTVVANVAVLHDCPNAAATYCSLGLARAALALARAPVAAPVAAPEAATAGFEKVAGLVYDAADYEIAAPSLVSAVAWTQALAAFADAF